MGQKMAQLGCSTAHTTGLRASPRKEERTMGSITRTFLRRLGREDSAQGMAEYALLAGLIAVVAIAAVTLLGGNINTTLNNIATAIGGAGS
jgi:pilus assembly protein Flp/PilA